jgi:hypothetical protein
MAPMPPAAGRYIGPVRAVRRRNTQRSALDHAIVVMR